MVELGEIMVTDCEGGVFVVTERVQWDAPDDELLVHLASSLKKRDAIRYANRLIKTFGECST